MYDDTNTFRPFLVTPLFKIIPVFLAPDGYRMKMVRTNETSKFQSTVYEGRAAKTGAGRRGVRAERQGGGSWETRGGSWETVSGRKNSLGRKLTLYGGRKWGGISTLLNTVS